MQEESGSQKGTPRKFGKRAKYFGGPLWFPVACYLLITTCSTIIFSVRNLMAPAESNVNAAPQAENLDQATIVIDEPETHVSASGAETKYTLIFEPKSRRAKWAFNVLQARRQNSKLRRNEYNKITARTPQASDKDEWVDWAKKELITPTVPSSTHFVPNHFSENLTQERRHKIMQNFKGLSKDKSDGRPAYTQA